MVDRQLCQSLWRIWSSVHVYWSLDRGEVSCASVDKPTSLQVRESLYSGHCFMRPPLSYKTIFLVRSLSSDKIGGPN